MIFCGRKNCFFNGALSDKHNVIHGQCCVKTIVRIDENLKCFDFKLKDLRK
jgi:hypothetical protein